ncbi:hypothetical protein TNCV_4952011 [Trichonephila clavipes]|nr:hypothetical protein TNCV_4952011 [Trichonephila clavipes]
MSTKGFDLCFEKSTLKFPLTIVDIMLTKYQMIKFIDSCEVWFLPESVARVAAIVRDHRCHPPRIDSEKLWMCSWGTADQAASTRCQR